MNGQPRPRRATAAAAFLAPFALSSCCFFSTVTDPVYKAHMKTAFSPGAQTGSLDALEQDFRKKIEGILRRLKKRGWHPFVRSTYRSPRRQEAMYNYSRTKEFFGASPGTHARGGESCHNHRDEQGRPWSLAADIVPGKGDKQDSKNRARFYWALGKAAKKSGLGWGGSWAKTNPSWRKYGLGWDPAHVQSKRCTWKLLKKDRQSYSGEGES